MFFHLTSKQASWSLQVGMFGFLLKAVKNGREEAAQQWSNDNFCEENVLFREELSNIGIRTIAKFRLLTKIDFNVMHLINLSKKIWQKLQIRGSRGLQNSAISDTFFQFLTILCSKNASN